MTCKKCGGEKYTDFVEEACFCKPDPDRGVERRNKSREIKKARALKINDRAAVLISFS